MSDLNSWGTHAEVKHLIDFHNRYGRQEEAPAMSATTKVQDTMMSNDRDEWDECSGRVSAQAIRWSDEALNAACDAVLIAGIVTNCQHAVHAALRAEMRRRAAEVLR